jgi:hypothetical protein
MEKALPLQLIGASPGSSMLGFDLFAQDDLPPGLRCTALPVRFLGV